MNVDPLLISLANIRNFQQKNSVDENAEDKKKLQKML